MVDAQIAVAQAGQDLHIASRNGIPEQFCRFPDAFLLFGTSYTIMTFAVVSDRLGLMVYRLLACKKAIISALPMAQVSRK